MSYYVITQKKPQVTFHFLRYLVYQFEIRGNGQVERYVSTVLDLLRTEIIDKSEWTSAVVKVQKALDTSVQKTTGFSPLYLLTGQNDSSDIQALTSSVSAINSTSNLENDRKLAYESIWKQAEMSKNLFDKNRRNHKNIGLGDFVYHPSGNSHLAKLDAKYEGPFEVIQVLPHDRFELKNLLTNRKRTVAKDMLRLWPGEVSEDLEL